MKRDAYVIYLYNVEGTRKFYVHDYVNDHYIFTIDPAGAYLFDSKEDADQASWVLEDAAGKSGMSEYDGMFGGFCRLKFATMGSW